MEKKMDKKQMYKGIVDYLMNEKELIVTKKVTDYMESILSYNK